MIPDLKKGECGDCGNDKFQIFKQKDVDDQFVCECTKCKNTSIITLSRPKLEIEWGEDSKGILHF
jgi:hypothetical protein